MMKKDIHCSEYLSDPVVSELIEASNDGFWDWNIEKGEVHFSRRWVEMLGYCLQEIEPNVKSWEKIIHPDDMPYVMKVLKDHLEGKTEHYETEHRVLCKNGEWKWILDRGRVISRSPDGKPLRAAGSHTDITDKVLREIERQKFLEQEERSKNDLLELNYKLQEAVKLRNEFLSIASHELKTPLTSLILLVQSMKKTLALFNTENFLEKLTKTVNQTEKQLLRLTRLVDDMLDITRIESGKLILNKEIFNLAELIEEISERLSPQIQAETGEPLKILRLDRVEGSWDRYRIEQAITNLITNAIKYGNGKTIELSLIDEGESALISVKDYGMGIMKDHQEKIFNLFERGSGPKGISGLGLGLFISKQIIESHQGKIWVESVPGSGSTFFIKIPLNKQ